MANPSQGQPRQPQIDVLLIRHGERDHSGVNAGLTALGNSQCSRLGQGLQALGLNYGRLICSPKNRCVESARILGLELGLSYEVAFSVDERKPGESQGNFETRVFDWLLELKAGAYGAAVIVVSHLDWLEQVGLELFPGGPMLSWNPANCHWVTILGQKINFKATL